VPDQDRDLTRLFVRDLDDIALPPRERWRRAPRKESMLMNATRTIAFGAAAVAVLVLAVIASLALGDRTPIAASPTPSASITPPPSATASATSTASPTTAAASATPASSPTPAGGTRYVSVVGYSIETPSPWHLSTCSERYQGVEPMGDEFVPVPAYEETATDIGPQYPTLGVITAANPDNLTPRQWLAQRKSPSFSSDGGEPLEDVTYAGRPAVRKAIREATGVYHYMVANAGRMFVVSPRILRTPNESQRTSLIRMIDSFQFISDAERSAARAALPPAPAPRTAQQVADALADAFAAKDTRAIAPLAAACVYRAGENAGGSSWSRDKYLDDLKAMFAAGLTVTVQPRPITQDSQEQATVMATWQDSRGSQTRRMVLTRGPNDNWRWAGTIERYQ